MTTTIRVTRHADVRAVLSDPGALTTVTVPAVNRPRFPSDPGTALAPGPTTHSPWPQESSMPATHVEHAMPDRAEEFRSLHRPGAPFVLPNAWDLASAAALARAGFPAIGTTSLGVASAAGKPDAAGDTRDETLALARGMARLGVPVTVDVESGFGCGEDGGAELAVELAASGIAGANLEDGRADGGLAGIDEQCALIRAVKAAAPSLFLNARIDTYWLPFPAGATERVSATFERARAYRDSGADGIFVPGLADEGTIGDLTGRVALPLNVLAPPDPGALDRLARAGVARISTGSLLFRAALHSTVETALAVAGGKAADGAAVGGAAGGGGLGYSDVQSLAEVYGRYV